MKQEHGNNITTDDYPILGGDIVVKGYHPLFERLGLEGIEDSESIVLEHDYDTEDEFKDAVSARHLAVSETIQSWLAGHHGNGITTNIETVDVYDYDKTGETHGIFISKGVLVYGWHPYFNELSKTPSDVRPAPTIIRANYDNETAFKDAISNTRLSVVKTIQGWLDALAMPPIRALYVDYDKHVMTVYEFADLQTLFDVVARNDKSRGESTLDMLSTLTEMVMIYDYDNETLKHAFEMIGCGETYKCQFVTTEKLYKHVRLWVIPYQVNEDEEGDEDEDDLTGDD